MRDFELKQLAAVVLVCITVSVGVAMPKNADYTANDLPLQAEAFGVEEQLGATLPMDLMLTNAAGESVPLRSFFADGQPVLLVPQYYECPMLCGLVMNGVSRALDALKLTIGQDFQFLGVSIDHNEGPDLAAAKQQGYSKAYKRAGSEAGWQFAVGSEEAIATLMQSIGYNFQYDQDRDEFAHAAALVVVTPEGVISRYLYGIDFSPRDMRLALVEASAGKIGNVVDRLMLYCYHYDPQTRRYTLLATNMMRGGAVVTILGIGTLLATLRRRESSNGAQDEGTT